MFHDNEIEFKAYFTHCHAMKAIHLQNGFITDKHRYTFYMTYPNTYRQ